jgi:drug/metabolite transporter (DMT)-like permease
MFSWGLSWTNGKILGEYGNTDIIIVWRFFFASIFFFPYLLYTRNPLLPNRKSIPHILINSFLIIGYNIFYFAGTKIGYAGAGGVLVTTLNPILTTILMMFFFDKKISINEQFGLFFGIIGGVIIIQVWKDNSFLQSGNIFFILASLCWVLVTINTYVSRNKINFTTYSFWSFLFGFIFYLPFTRGQNIFIIFNYDYIFWLNFLIISFGAMAFGQSIYFNATAILGAKKASSFILMVPISAIIFAILILEEPVIGTTIFGGFLGLYAIYLINK